MISNATGKSNFSLREQRFKNWANNLKDLCPWPEGTHILECIRKLQECLEALVSSLVSFNIFSVFHSFLEAL